MLDLDADAIALEVNLAIFHYFFSLIFVSLLSFHYFIVVDPIALEVKLDN